MREPRLTWKILFACIGHVILLSWRLPGLLQSTLFIVTPSISTSYGNLFISTPCLRTNYYWTYRKNPLYSHNLFISTFSTKVALFPTAWLWRGLTVQLFLLTNGSLMEKLSFINDRSILSEWINIKSFKFEWKKLWFTERVIPPELIKRNWQPPWSKLLTWCK